MIATPATDRLGREGVYFPNHFCTTSLCSPSRASILSGLYAHAHGVSDNFTEYPREMPTWPRALQQAGYETAYVGKYHMGEDNDDVRGGFDYFVTHRGQGKYFDTEFRFNGGARRIVKGDYTTVVTRIAKQWIAGRRARLGVDPRAQGAHSFTSRSPSTRAFDHVNIPIRPDAFRLDDNDACVKDRLDTWLRHLRPAVRLPQRRPDRSPAGVEDFAAMVRGYWGTILGRRQRGATSTGCLRKTANSTTR